MDLLRFRDYGRPASAEILAACPEPVEGKPDARGLVGCGREPRYETVVVNRFPSRLQMALIVLRPEIAAVEMPIIASAQWPAM